MALHPLHGLVDQLSTQPILIGGKGGVGKTTTAAALASYYASQQKKTLIVWPDQRGIASVMCGVYSSIMKKVAIYPHLDAIELNPDVIVDAHFAQVESTIKSYANPDMMPKIRERRKLWESAPRTQERPCSNLYASI